MLLLISLTGTTFTGLCYLRLAWNSINKTPQNKTKKLPRTKYLITDLYQMGLVLTRDLYSTSIFYILNLRLHLYTYYDRLCEIKDNRENKPDGEPVFVS